MDREIACGQVQHLFMIKLSEIKYNFLELMKGIFEKISTSLVLNGEF